MDLESRMATVETDLSAVRKQELPSLRAELERKYHDLRVETHGWAEVAIKAGNKVDRASEVVNLIYTEVRETREEVRAIRGEVAEVRTGLTEVRGEMSALRTEVRGEITELRTELRGEMTELRGEMTELRTEVRGEITGVRGEIAQVRAEQDLQRETLASIEKELGEQGDTLQKILAKLS
jgi:chromosome segregation ATPase